ncbi:saccharopine dehydrogenase [Nocardioides mangrovicus]|uniref:Saccharopine dehydrogenase n=1 Tax=Nocardioides mangrovicus TaxID=2478913 RepID=A0A3L8NX31_9ACTN|nr:saccharopine dehydrogenase NADP-binding domain-containing protein [Nocardioides mangrovicus]RLV47484.1 saccharopine dehydrogenase [Nocardioides mangrovicus]
MSDAREYDLVLLGATGFTGGLTAEYLARQVPEGCRWALAGRNPAKLEEVRARLGAAHADLPLLQADVTDPESLASLARAARVIVSTVGPYVEYGEPLVAACAEAGTDYLDLTGEPEFVDTMYVRHHATAVSSGARLVHACGFDSVPHDLGARFTVLQLPEGEPVTLRGVVRAGAQFSGGTFASALTAFARGRQMRSAMQQRRQVEPRPEGRRSKAVAGKPHRDAELGYWLVPLPTIDPFVVARSGAALERYGPDFRYSHYAGVKTLRYLAGGAVGLGALAAAAQLPPLRRFLLDKVPAGEGPSAARRQKSWFTVDFVGEAGGQQVRTRVSGGDPGYDETAKMLGESALSLAFDDDNPATAGQVTPAVAMGENLTRRLQDAGLRFETVAGGS